MGAIALYSAGRQCAGPCKAFMLRLIADKVSDFCIDPRAWILMKERSAILDKDKFKEYTRFASHCLDMVP